MFYNEPLSHRMRPRTIDEVVGQDDVIGPKTALYRMLQNGHIPSLLFYGPPGTGKRLLLLQLQIQQRKNFMH